MRSEDFIGQCVRGEQQRSKTVASIYWDGETVYSYGKHYPLLINISGNWILNDRGYSSTTGKHISWAREYADGVVSIPNGVTSYNSFNGVSVNEIRGYIVDEITEKSEELKGLSSRAFRKKERLEQRCEELRETLRLIKDA